VRIGLIAPPWVPVPPVAYGGTEAVIDNLACALQQLGHDVTLFTVGDSTCPVRRVSLFAEAVQPMGQSLPEAAHALAAYDALADVDAIHDHTVLGPLVGIQQGPNAAPIAVTNHGIYDASALRLFRHLSRRAWVIAISHDQGRRAVGVDVSAVIHHGIDLDLYRPGGTRGEHLIFIGRMSPTKGVHRALRIARATQRPIRIIAKMRDADEREYFRSQVRPLMSRQDELPDELSLSERIRELQSAAALVNPISWPEPFGLVMAESLAVGTPVIASHCGAAPEIVRDGITGFLCDSVDSAAVAVRRLHTIDRGACRADAEQRFSRQRMARDHEDVYRRMMSSAFDAGDSEAHLRQPVPDRKPISSGDLLTGGVAG
jgi:glycosyltransferase involved in cell wall biosynthesis